VGPRQRRIPPAAPGAPLRLRCRLAEDHARSLGLTTWNDDSWAGESYSALTVEVADGDDELIAAPPGRVHIAGEHTAGAWSGLMEGALRSGLRAADAVLSTVHRTRVGP